MTNETHSDLAINDKVKYPDSSTDEIKRFTPPNPYNYTPSQLAKRSNTIATMAERHPTTPHAWICNLYDILEHKSLEEIKDILDNKLWEGAPKERQKGGTIANALTILEPGEDPHKTIPLVVG